MASFTLNGVPTTVGDSHANLLDALREECGITSAKDGCAPQGQCGCCTVHLNGVGTKSCAVLALTCEGANVTTIEGRVPDPAKIGDPDRRRAVERALGGLTPS